MRCTQAEAHHHTHGPDCGHRAIIHGNHVDYLHGSEAHREREGHYDVCPPCQCEACPDCVCATCQCPDCDCANCFHGKCECQNCSDTCNNCTCADCDCPHCAHAA